MGGWMDGWMDGWIDRSIDRQIDRKTFIYIYIISFTNSVIQLPPKKYNSCQFDVPNHYQ